MMFFNKKTQQTLCCDEKCFWIEYWFVFWEERFISELLLAKQFFESHILLIYFLLKSFIRIYIETWNLSFCFQHYLFVLKLVIDRAILQYLEFVFFFFWFYELNAVLSTHSNIDFESVIYKLFLGKIYYDLLVV